MVIALLVRPEMTEYYQSRAALEKSIKDNEKVAKVIEQYKAQISLIEREPNVLARIQQHTLGQTPSEPDAVYPVEYNKELAVLARNVLNEAEPVDPNSQMPIWITRCTEQRNRTAIFLAGAGLVLITFMFFGGPRKVKAKKKLFYSR